MPEVARYTQQGRPIGVETPLGEDVLLLGSVEIHEGLSKLFQLGLTLFSEHDDIAASEIVGKPVDVRMELRSGETRWFNGIVSRFSTLGRDDRLTRYSAEVVPWTWLLTRRADCRIFQEKTVVEIVSEVFRDAGFGDSFDVSGLSENYPLRDYCVQYRESDFAFVSRLLEEEGIFYRFEHKPGGHRLLLLDGVHGYDSCDESSVSCPDRVNAANWGDDLDGWRHEYEFVSGRWSARDWNFKTPDDSLEAKADGSQVWQEAKEFEQFDYPGEWSVKADGERLTRVRQEEEQQRQEVVVGRGRCRSFFAGGTFEIARHHVPTEVGREFVLTRVRHELRAMAPFATTLAPEDGDGPMYVGHFECIPAERVFRPRRETPRPTVRGVQTAVVVGPSGEEIHVDEHARVKVQFHWDRRGTHDENSSCWIRVAQPWAGAGYGGLCIPRIGQEVIIEFEEGDPDRPLINGRMYNAGQMPPASNAGRDPSAGPSPESVREAAMMTSLKSSSLGGGGGSNEITLNDTGGAEGLFLKAQKDSINKVGNDQTTMIGNNREESVGVDHTEIIGNNSTQNIGVNHTMSVGTAQSVSIGSKKSETVGQTSMENVGVAKMINIGVAQMLSVGGVYAVNVGGAMNTAVGMVSMERVGMIKSINVGNKFEITCGSSKLTMDSSGKITLEGTDITIKSSGPIETEAGAEMTQTSGGVMSIKADGNVDIDGKIIELN